ncbi:metallophosphoesterase [Gordonia jinhuaensis]|uniref:Metallophosphoesterase n=1 Tax=Gordonia jinhuaensis TaxID=1517702 RepID=A0A916WP25_9ACTN|nr:metallophosphoesterase [Gordonia jinhuaensis]GGB16378.1 metallophosphoesterase [Gordonia jinhuaensis]
MVRVLAVSDEIVDSLLLGAAAEMRPDLILAAGDLPFDYLESLMISCNAPLAYVPGNHDPDLSGYRRGRTGWTRAGMPASDPGPLGAIALDGRVRTVAGLRIAGLGGSIRYSDGPNQYRESAMRIRAARLAVRVLAARFIRPGRTGERMRSHVHAIDVLLTHSPARGFGDAPDPAHRGFACFVGLVRALTPQVLIHGHIHPHGRPAAERAISWRRARGNAESTPCINTVGYCLFEIDPGGDSLAIMRRRRGT